HSVFGASWAALAAARSLRVPFVVTVHTRFDEYAHYAGLAAPLARTLVRPYTGAVVAAADLAIAPNDELAAELRAAGDARAVRVVPAPIDVRLAQGDASRGRARLGVAAGVPLLLSASRLAVEKRVLGHDAGGFFPSRAPSPEELAGCVDLLLDDVARRARMEPEAARRAELAWSPRTVAASLRDAYAAASRVTE